MYRPDSIFSAVAIFGILTLVIVSRGASTEDFFSGAIFTSEADTNLQMDTSHMAGIAAFPDSPALLKDAAGHFISDVADGFLAQTYIANSLYSLYFASRGRAIDSLTPKPTLAYSAMSAATLGAGLVAEGEGAFRLRDGSPTGVVETLRSAVKTYFTLSFNIAATAKWYADHARQPAAGAQRA